MDTRKFHRFSVKMAAVVVAKCTLVKFIVRGISCECGPGPEYREVAFRIDAYDAVKVAVDTPRGDEMPFCKLAYIEL